MADKDTTEYLRKSARETADKDTIELAQFLQQKIQPITELTMKAYTKSEIQGNKILELTLFTTLTATSKNIDESLQRLEQIHKNTRNTIIKLDKKVNKCQN